MPSSDPNLRASRAWQHAHENNILFPDVPAVYAIYFDGELGYIGQTVRLSGRLSSYHIHINLFGGPLWVTPWGSFNDVRIKFKLGHRYGDWLMREARLIRRLKPKFNSSYGLGWQSVRAIKTRKAH